MPIALGKATEEPVGKVECFGRKVPAMLDVSDFSLDVSEELHPKTRG